MSNRGTLCVAISLLLSGCGAPSEADQATDADSAESDASASENPDSTASTVDASTDEQDVDHQGAVDSQARAEGLRR